MGRAAKIGLPGKAPAEARLPVARPRLPSADDLTPYLRRIDEARWYSNFGPLVTEFEGRLAERFGPRAKVTTAVNATQILTLALKAMELPEGSLCALPSWTFVATAHAVVQAGLTPWFLDVDADTWMLDPDLVRAALPGAPGRVSAVIPVCAHGAMPDLDAWVAFRAETGLPVLVDAAAAFDQARDARLPTAVSLHATKALGIGEGGFLATEDHDLAARVRQMTSYGFQGSRESQFIATNAKLSEYAAAIGLAALDAWPLDRARFCFSAQMLRAVLITTPEVAFQPGWGSDWATSVCVVGLPPESAEAVAASLAREGIETRRWWGDGCHKGRAFGHYPCGEMTVTDRLARSTLGLPFAIDLPPAVAHRIGLAVRRALGAPGVNPGPKP